MSFGTYARRARDGDLPYWARYCALRCAVGHYCPIGFHATWSYLSTVGDLKVDEGALLRALEILETSRGAWLAEMDAYAARRRAEKKRHRRSPTMADRLRLYSYRWPGPDGHQATLNAVEHLWAQHRAAPFPETPAEFKGDLVYLDSTIAGCVSTYVGRGGMGAPGHRDILLACIPPLRLQLGRLGYPTDYYMAFGYFRRLGKLAQLVINDTADHPATQSADAVLPS
ncbi:hypothetical protein ABIA35_001086 [Catenulispora sp. MAP12-49]|uniref:hypothetical protein n=1 Tax=Catenulispora sp. MAP12-49 TaxID=3156302 RepID=UPI00351304A6